MDFFETVAGRNFCDGLVESAADIAGSLNIIVDLLREQAGDRRILIELLTAMQLQTKPIKSEVTNNTVSEVCEDDDIPF